MSGQRTVHVTILKRHLGKALMVLLHERRQERVARRDGIYAG
jgi:hypothetical protein